MIGGYLIKEDEVESLEQILRDEAASRESSSKDTKTAPHVVDLLTLAEITEIRPFKTHKRTVLGVTLRSEEKTEPQKTLDIESKIRPTVREMVREAATSLQGQAKNKEIKHYIQEKYGNINPATINCHILLSCVNSPSRLNYPENQKPRIANIKSRDFLFHLSRGVVELFDPKKHGTWEIRQNSKGKLEVGRVTSSEYQKQIKTTEKEILEYGSKTMIPPIQKESKKIKKSKPFVWEMIKEAIEKLGGRVEYSEIRNYIGRNYGDVKKSTINAHITLCSVNNKNRIHYPQNKKPRIATKYLDFLYRVDRGVVEYFNPEKHGYWEINQDEQGNLTVAKLGGEAELIKPPIAPPQTLVKVERVVAHDVSSYPLLRTDGIVVDGNNVVYNQINRSQGEKPEIQRLQILHEQLQQWFLPNNIFIFVSAALRYYADDEQMLTKLIHRKIVNETPAKRSDDFFIIQEALDSNYYILSNDQYNDWKRKYPSMAYEIEDRRVTFVWFARSNRFNFDEKLPSSLRKS